MKIPPGYTGRSPAARWTWHPVTDWIPVIIIPGRLIDLSSSTACSTRALPREMVSGGPASSSPIILTGRALPSHEVPRPLHFAARYMRHVNAVSCSSLGKSFSLAAALAKNLPCGRDGLLRHLGLACAQHQAGQHCKDAFERSDYFLVSHFFSLFCFRESAQSTSRTSNPTTSTPVSP